MGVDYHQKDMPHKGAAFMATVVWDTPSGVMAFGGADRYMHLTCVGTFCEGAGPQTILYLG